MIDANTKNSYIINNWAKEALEYGTQRLSGENLTYQLQDRYLAVEGACENIVDFATENNVENAGLMKKLFDKAVEKERKMNCSLKYCGEYTAVLAAIVGLTSPTVAGVATGQPPIQAGPNC